MIEVEISLNTWGMFGREDWERIGRIQIINDGTGTSQRGNYDAKIYDRSGKRVIRTVRIENWPRKTKTATELLAAVLKEAYPSC